jgi:hypothetical protein
MIGGQPARLIGPLIHPKEKKIDGALAILTNNAMSLKQVQYEFTSKNKFK